MILNGKKNGIWFDVSMAQTNKYKNTCVQGFQDFSSVPASTSLFTGGSFS